MKSCSMGHAEAQGEDRYLMEFRHVISSMVVKNKFSDYIALTGQFNHFLHIHDSEVISPNETTNNQDKENNVSFSVTLNFYYKKGVIFLTVAILVLCVLFRRMEL